MKTPPDDMMETVRRDLASWHATHPDATFADLETAVEEKIRHLRTALLAERTEEVRQEEHPACPSCGATMVPRSRSSRTVVMPGEEVIPVERVYVVCPACGTGLFPPG
jgi:YgiT-type zinc finger domain-containing protein